MPAMLLHNLLGKSSASFSTLALDQRRLIFSHSLHSTVLQKARYLALRSYRNEPGSPAQDRRQPRAHTYTTPVSLCMEFIVELFSLFFKAVC